VQKKKNSKNYKRTLTYLYMQKLKCPKCNRILGGKATTKKNGKSYFYYYCNECKIEFKENVINDYFNQFISELVDIEISSSIVYSSISDSKIKNAVNIYLRIIEKEVIPTFIEKVLNKAVSDFNIYYSAGKIYWNSMIIELIGKGYMLLSNSDKTTYLTRIRNLIGNSTYCNLGISATKIIWENLDIDKKQKLLQI